MCRRRALAVAVCIELLARAAPAVADERIWLDVARPYNGWVEQGVNPLLEVRGAAGAESRGVLDLVIIVDVSRSTKRGSGVDVNKDGHLGGVGWRHRRDWGSYLRHPQTSSDPEDSILHAEIEAVQRLLKQLDPARTRVGLVTLREIGRLRSSIGNSYTDTAIELEHLKGDRPTGRTNMADALRVAIRALDDAEASAGPHRVIGIVLLSDGSPTAPGSERMAADEAVRVAREASDAGIRIDALALGVSDEDSRALREIARVGRGRYIALREPGEILVALPNIDLLAPAEVSVVNTTTGEKARAVRVWADGSFDGFVELRPGKNRILVKARGRRGAETSQVRIVYYENRPARSDRERRLENAKLERLRDFLRDRSVQVEIAREKERRQAERAGAASGRSVKVETDR